MVFYLAPSIGGAILASPTPNLVNALQHLADSRRCGQNEILGEREVFQAIALCNDLSRPARAVYERLGETSTRTRNLLSECAVYVLVTEEPSVFRRESDKIVISVDYLANKQQLTQKTGLLCENLDDCEFFVWIASIYSYQNDFPGTIQFLMRNGGGSTTAPNYKHILDGRDELCLCVCDSDHKYEGDTSLGATASALHRVHTDTDTTLSELLILRCQEAENLVPGSILTDVYNVDTTKLEAASELENIQNSSTHQLWRYFDVKNGIRAFDFVSSSNALYQASWGREFGPPANTIMNVCRGCSSYRSCESKSDCAKYLASGLGKAVLQDTIAEFFKNRSKREVIRRLPRQILSEWDVVGRVVWAWGVTGFDMPAC